MVIPVGAAASAANSAGAAASASNAAAGASSTASSVASSSSVGKSLPGTPAGSNLGSPKIKSDPNVSFAKDQETGALIPDGKGFPGSTESQNGSGSDGNDVHSKSSRNGLDISNNNNDSSDKGEPGEGNELGLKDHLSDLPFDIGVNTKNPGRGDNKQSPLNSSGIQSFGGLGDSLDPKPGNPALDADKSPKPQNGERSLLSGPINDLLKTATLSMGPATTFVRKAATVATLSIMVVIFLLVSMVSVVAGGSGAATASSSAFIAAAASCQVEPSAESDALSGGVSASSIEELKGMSVGPYGEEQLTNAAYIIRAAYDSGMGERGALFGVMAAMGESSLRVIDYGDTVGPDSRGLFQQRDNGAWGSYEDRMDPYISATNFFKAMKRNVPDWARASPSYAIHMTQINADPNHYSKYEPQAREIVNAVKNVSPKINLNASQSQASDGSSESKDDASEDVSVVSDSSSSSLCLKKSEVASEAISGEIGSCAPKCPGIDGPQEGSIKTSLSLAMSEVGTARATGWNQPGECIVSVRRWLNAGGFNFGYGGVVGGYLNSPAVRVTDGSLRPGDVIQYTNISSPDAFGMGIHTYMVAKVNSDGTHDLVESNNPGGSGRVVNQKNFTVSPPPGWQAYVWRFAKSPDT